MEFLKSIAGKVVTGLVVIAVIAAGISWFQMTPEARETLLGGTGKVTAWVFAVLLAPWATFFLSTWAARFGRNLAGALLVGAYTVVEAVGLAWLFGWTLRGGTAWTFFAVGVLFAAVYNVFTCDWIAEKAG